MFEGKVRKAGNSLVTTIPKDEANRLAIEAGTRVVVTVSRISRRLVSPLPAEVLERRHELTLKNLPVLRLLRD